MQASVSRSVPSKAHEIHDPTCHNVATEHSDCRTNALKLICSGNPSKDWSM